VVLIAILYSTPNLVVVIFSVPSAAVLRVLCG
jgi:hypothetical protein